MGSYQSTSTFYFSAEGEPSITASRSSSPQPAARIGLGVNIKQKAFHDRFEAKLIISHATPIRLHRTGPSSDCNLFTARNTILTQEFA